MASSILCQRTLSVFKPFIRGWAPAASGYVPTGSAVTQKPTLTSRLSLITWNLDAFSSLPVTRSTSLLADILEESKRPDIIFLQEVTTEVLTSILANPIIREAFLVTDAEDQSSFMGVPFANMTLLSRKRFLFSEEGLEKEDEVGDTDRFLVGPVWRVKLPSKYKRCALSVDIIHRSTHSNRAASYRLINVHLDSLGDTLLYRAEQLGILADLLREPGCSGGVIAGDFNAITSVDHLLPTKNGLVDAWIALHGTDGPHGATWGVGVRRRDGLGPGRLDKVAVLGVEAKDMQILPPGKIQAPSPGGHFDRIPCTDHHGLRLDFTV